MDRPKRANPLCDSTNPNSNPHADSTKLAKHSADSHRVDSRLSKPTSKDISAERSNRSGRYRNTRKRTSQESLSQPAPERQNWIRSSHWRNIHGSADGSPNTSSSSSRDTPERLRD